MGKHKRTRANTLLKKAIENQAASLDLGYSSLKGDEKYLAEMLPKAEHLRELILANRWVDYQGFAEAPALVPEMKVSENFSAKEGRGKLRNRLHALPALPPKLEKLVAKGHLWKEGYKITDDNLFHFSDLLPLSDCANTLTYLDLSWNMGISEKSFATLPCFDKLQVLILEGCQVAELDFLAKFPALEVLNLRGNRIKDLSPLQDYKAKLRYLNLNGNGIAFQKAKANTEGANEAEQMNALMPHLGNLRFLDLGGNTLAPEAIPDFKGKENLKVLSLERTPKKDDTAHPLEKIRKKALYDNLEALNLSGYKLSGENLSFLRSFKKLRRLQLRNCSLCDIPELITRDQEGLSTLEVLDLSNNEIKKFNTRLDVSLPNLRHLNLRNNPLREKPFKLLTNFPALQVFQGNLPDGEGEFTFRWDAGQFNFSLSLPQSEDEGETDSHLKSLRNNLLRQISRSSYSQPYKAELLDMFGTEKPREVLKKLEELTPRMKPYYATIFHDLKRRSQTSRKLDEKAVLAEDIETFIEDLELDDE